MDMTGNKNTAQKTVPGPHGERLGLNDLPPPSTRRWVIRRKAIVVAAVDGGLITPEFACKHYGLSLEELESWARDYHEFGLQGLRITKLQQYRQKLDESAPYDLPAQAEKAAE